MTYALRAMLIAGLLVFPHLASADDIDDAHRLGQVLVDNGYVVEYEAGIMSVHCVTLTLSPTGHARRAGLTPEERANIKRLIGQHNDKPGGTADELP